MPERNFNLNIIVSASDRASSVLGLIGGGVQNLGSVAMMGFGAIAAGVGVAAAGLGAFATQAIASNSAFEQYETQFATLLGSTEAAQQRMEELARFGATTPFDLPGVVEANRILTGFGLTADDVADRFGFDAQQIMTIAGDVASGTGLSFQEMALLMGKFSAGATGEVIARFQELGIMTREQMTAMGIEFSKSGEMLTPLPEAMEIVLGMMEDKYGGLMDAQSQTFEGMMSNIRDWVGSTIREVGKPIFDKAKQGLNKLLEFLSGEFVKESLAAFAAFASQGVEKAIEAIEELVKLFGGFVADIQSGTPPIEALSELVRNLFGSDVADKFGEVADIVMQIYDAVSAVLGPVIEWFAVNTQLQDVLMILGIALASVVIPAIWGVLAPILAAVGIFVGLIALITALREAWEHDFLGIRTAVETIWNEGLKPVFDELGLWLSKEGPGALDTLRAFWEEKLLPGIQHVGTWITTTLMPLLTRLVVDYLQRVWEGVKILAAFWTNELQPALEVVWAFIQDKVLPVLGDLISNGLEAVGTAVDALVYVWNEYLLPALRAVWEFLNTVFIPIIQTLAEIVSTIVYIAVKSLSNLFEHTVLPILKDIWAFMELYIIPIFKELAEKIDANVMPALRPLATFLKGTLYDAITTVNRVWNAMVTALTSLYEWLKDVLQKLKEVASAMGAVPGAGVNNSFAPPPGDGGSGNFGGSSGAVSVQNFYINYESRQNSQGVYSDVETLKARYGAR
jgi:hypothetical protein